MVKGGFFWYNGWMRTILVFGLLALFTLVSFVPPSGGGYTIASAQTLPLEFNTNVNGVINYVKTTTQNAAKNLPKVNVTLPSEINIDAKEVAPTLFKKMLSFAVDAAKDKIAPEPEVTHANWRDAAEEETNDVLKHYFVLIEWAREKHDVRACSELSPTVLEERIVKNVSYQTPSHDDWIAYCLARVTGNSDRCQQIQSGILPRLQTLCFEELQ